ncbi:MAG: caspase family protein, partial [Chromatocurvus sp.]
CRIRGGEYVAYDRADYKTALKVWLPAAESGEADAQNAVGEIFERGLGGEPNYELAFVWYQRAAEQGHKGAQVNLATLYETGRGVEQDKRTALNWYRRAWGIGEDELVHRSDAERELLAQAQETAAAQEAARRAGKEAEAARSALEEARASAARAQREAVAASREVGEAREREATLSREVEETRKVVEQLQEVLAEPDVITRDGKTYGRYFALVIGNSDYVHLSNLDTPMEDTRRLSKVLTERYGFQVRRVSNADNTEILRALNALNDVLREDDNLLLYYSGHGNSRSSGSYDAGYWLPVNAEAPPDDTFWVPTEQVSGHLARLKARRIMVVADSAFAGLLADNPAFLLATDPDQLRSDAYINLRLPNRSRLLMTSGVDAPVPRLRAGYTSVFA